MAKWPFIPWRQSTASKFRPDSLNYGCLSVSKSGEVSAGDSNNKAVPVLPTGSVIPFAGKTAPTGWLMCQGQAVSRTTYAQLFSVIGTTFGSGDGSTTFNLPDLRGRVAVGVDSDANLGLQTGEKAHVLTASELASHVHTQTAVSSHVAGSPGDIGAAVTDGNVYWSNTAASTNSGVQTYAAGDNLEHNNMQPSLYLNYLVKV